MTKTELKAKWTETQFNVWKLQGIISPGITYDEYLEMRREQEELCEQQLQEILTEYGTLPNEEPPETDEEYLHLTIGQKKLSAFFGESPLVGVELDLTGDTRS